MTCHDAREQFSALVDDALAPGERAALDAHLTTCADCRRELQRFRDTVALVRAVGPVRAPAGFVDRALEAARPVPWYRRLVRGLFLPWPVKLPIEAAAIVLVAVGVALVYRGAPELRQAARFDSVAPAVSRAPESTAPPAPGPGPAPERETDARRAQYRARELPRAPDQVQSSVKDQGVKGPAEMQDKPTVATPPAPAAQQSAPLSRDAEPQKTLERGETKEPRASVAERERGEYLRAQPAPATPTPRPDQAKRSAPAVTGLAFAPPTGVSGRLAASDPDLAVRGVSELGARLGAVENRRVDAPGGGYIVELTVSREAYAEFVRELARLGRWQPSKEPSELPAQVRVVLQITR
ncbi:MAG: hypothetical protein DMD87_00885 [Candidatus Rokuibacteriota bacterium]|nr:MAG: hypothetical protein DMD87_00885 [Candidatus Rokubacteria bacterium]